MNQNLPVETDTSGIELCLSLVYIYIIHIHIHIHITVYYCGFVGVIGDKAETARCLPA